MTTYKLPNPGPGDDPIYRELFYISPYDDQDKLAPGWYWMPAGMPNFDPTGPFETEAAAFKDAQP